MKSGLYSIKDDLVGKYEFYGSFLNDSIAIRSFKMATSGENIPVSDLSLYRFGEFDNDTGEICSYDLEFLMRGKKDEV